MLLAKVVFNAACVGAVIAIGVLTGDPSNFISLFGVSLWTISCIPQLTNTSFAADKEWGRERAGYYIEWPGESVKVGECYASARSLLQRVFIDPLSEQR